jgi:hypothetical protein
MTMVGISTCGRYDMPTVTVTVVVTVTVMVLVE